VFPDRKQLLSQQMAETIAAFDRPSPVRPTVRPRLQLLHLRSRGADFHLAEHGLGCIHSNRGMRTLVRINADHHSCHRNLL